MLHVFFTHSNITSIVIYDTVNKLLSEGESVVIVTNRGQKWHSISNERIVDFSNLFIKSLLNTHYFSFLKKVRCKIRQTINKTPFYFYLPTSFDIICQQFQNYKYCKKYFYIEEGTLSYGHGGNYTNHNLYGWLKLYSKKLFGLKTKDFLLGKRFEGTIAISENAFRWNKKERIINTATGYIEANLRDQQDFKNFLIFGYLQNDIIDIEHIIDDIAKYLLKHNINAIAIKFHPRSYFTQPDKIEAITKYVLSKEMNVKVLDSNYIVEKSLFTKGSNVFCVQDPSSLIIYALQGGGIAFLSRIDKGIINNFLYKSFSQYASSSGYIDL